MKTNLVGLLRSAGEAAGNHFAFTLPELGQNLVELRQRTLTGDLSALDEFFTIYVIPEPPIAIPPNNPEHIAKQAPGKHQRWTKTDDEYMSKYYGKNGGLAVSKVLKRTVRAVQHRAYFLRLPRSGCWPMEDDDILRIHYPTKGARGCQIKLTVMRTRKAIIQRAHRLDLRYELDFQMSNAKPHRWTSGEDDLLRTKLVRNEIGELHSQYFSGSPYQRTYAAVALRCTALGLTRSDRKKKLPRQLALYNPVV